MHRASRRLASLGLAVALVGAAACSGDDGDNASDAPDTTEAVAAEFELDPAAADAAVATYAELVHTSYTDLVTSATAMQTAIDAFLAAPSDATLQAAKQSWLDARVLYGPTEVFRFYDGPIDDADDGPEGQINAWPLDEAYIDYVEGNLDAGIVNDVAGVPDITTEVLVAANEEAGETNISTGWHAIEFLLWGQDLSVDGPGARPVTDYTTAPNADRRGTYLKLLAQLLIDDLTSVRDQWAPGAEYRVEFERDGEQSIKNIFRGMGALAQGELAGERIAVAYDNQDQEDEHSCFSDNTTADIAGNARGVRMAYLADHPGIDTPSLSDAVAAAAPELDAALRASLDDAVAQAEALQAPFDQLFLGADDAPGRVQLDELIDDLTDLGDLIADTAAKVGHPVSIELG
ncbi:MAG: iron-regulated protein [Actinomycetota bacterium]|nr:iron-regulated protein [Actinomycetota bacterium]